MQHDLDDNYPLLNIDLLGVNEHNQAFANASVTAGRTLPWLQDTDADADNLSDVWTESWAVQWRDVVILNGANEKVGVYNLSNHNLATPAAYNELRGMLLDAAMLTQQPYFNKDDPLDVDDNGLVQPLDVLLTVNDLNLNGNGKFAPLTGTQLPTVFYDCNGDNIRGPADALAIIDFINERIEQNNEGEGEDEAITASMQVENPAIVGDADLADQPQSSSPNATVFTILDAPLTVELSADHAAFREASPTVRRMARAENRAASDSSADSTEREIVWRDVLSVSPLSDDEWTLLATDVAVKGLSVFAARATVLSTP